MPRPEQKVSRRLAVAGIDPAAARQAMTNASSASAHAASEQRQRLEHVRIGLVGAGFMAKTHSLAYSNARMLGGNDLPSIEPVRVADVEEELARAAASRFGWGQSTTEWREVTRAPDVDLVDIVTPNNAHAEIAIDAAEHGKHVICEKPLANTVESAREMHHAVESAGVANQVGFVFRTWPAVALAKKLVDEGRIGRIFRFRGHYLHD
ncbi:MAG: Gfo/Idh/MocA family protein, partial [Thermoleophilaceae bacterium]